MDPDELHFNTSLTVRDKLAKKRECPQTTAFERERRAEAEPDGGPSAYQLH